MYCVGVFVIVCGCELVVLEYWTPDVSQTGQRG